MATGGLLIFDLDNPTSPLLRSTTNVGFPALGVDVDPSRPVAAVALGGNGLRLVDVSNVITPALRGLLPGGQVNDVLMRGTTVLLADGTRSFTAVNAVNPDAPVITTSLPREFGGLVINEIAAAGDFAFVAEGFFVNDTSVIDISNPESPAARFLLRFPGDATGTGVKADASFVYLLSGGQLSIGQYRALTDNNGIAPQVSISAPASGSTVIARTAVPVTIQATDDVAVATVQLLVNGQVIGTAVSAPYIIHLPIPKGIESITVRARAIDLGGNIGTSAEVGYSVIVGPLTTVIGRGADRQGAAISAARVSVVNEFYGQSGVDGRYSVANVPASLVRVRAYGEVAVNNVVLRGRSALADVVPSGTTDVGPMVYFPDADWDGIPDEFEARYACLSANSADDEADPDGDALTNFREYELGTNPCLGNLLPGQTTVVTSLMSVRNGSIPSPGANEAVSALVSIGNGGGTPPPPSEAVSSLVSVRNGGGTPPSPSEAVSSLVSVRNGFLSGPQPGLSEAVSGLISVWNGPPPPTTLPPGLNQLASALLSVRNGGPPNSTTVNRPGGAFETGRKRGREILLATADSELPSSVAAGETLWLGYEPRAGQEVDSVEFLVDGASLGVVETLPFETGFVVPAGLSTLQVRAIVRERGVRVAHSDRLLAILDEASIPVQVALIDEVGLPLRNRNVTTLLPGLRAEYFDSSTALSGLPDLTGRTPDRIARVSSLTFRNPDGIFGPDPFGSRYSPDFAIRFSGLLEIPEDAEYRFHVRSHEGVRVEVDGEHLLSVPGGRSGSQEAEQRLALKAGMHRLVATYYATVGAPEVALSMAQGKAPLRPLDTNSLWHEEAGRSGEDGTMRWPDLPSWVRTLRFVMAGVTNEQREGVAFDFGRAAPVRVEMRKSGIQSER